jgi:hypothetical protein
MVPDSCSICGLQVNSRSKLKYHIWRVHRIVGKERRNVSYRHTTQVPLYMDLASPLSTRGQLLTRASQPTQNAPNGPSTTTTTPPVGFSGNNLAQSPQSYHSPQTNFLYSDSHDPPSEMTVPKTVPPDVAAARLTRMNRDLIAACRTKPSIRHDQPASFRGNGTYTHVASQDPQHYDDPVFLPLGGPNRCQPDRRTEPELPEEVNRAYEMLQRAMREEERLRSMGDTTDPRVRYSALEKPTAAFALPHMVDTRMGKTGPDMGGESVSVAGSGSGSAGGHSGVPKSATATTADANRNLKLKRKAMDDVYGRR